MAVMSAAMELTGMAGETAKPRDYSGFPWWHALLVTPGRETRAADLLERIRVFVYLPRFTKQVRTGLRGGHRSVLRPVIPGMLFVPRDMMDIGRRDETFDLCHVHGYIRNSRGEPTMIAKRDIEEIRRMEADLEIDNLPPGPLWVPAIGACLRFKNPTFRAFLGKGVVIEVDNRQRIRLQLAQLFGQPREITVPLADVEPDVADDAEA